MGFLSFLFGRSSKQSTSQNPVRPDPPVLKVAVFADGCLIVDGNASTFPKLKESLLHLSKLHGVVWYYREAGKQEPPPIAMEVMKVIVEFRLPIRLSSRTDYSDGIDLVSGYSSMCAGLSFEPDGNGIFQSFDKGE
jgi:hypothetical protein